MACGEWNNPGPSETLAACQHNDYSPDHSSSGTPDVTDSYEEQGKSYVPESSGLHPLYLNSDLCVNDAMIAILSYASSCHMSGSDFF